MNLANINIEWPTNPAPTRRHYNLAQGVVGAVISMFKRDADGVFRGEVTIDDAERDLMGRIGIEQYAEDLVEPMFDRDWHFEPCGLVAIPKGKGGHRFIAASGSRDRIRSRAIYKVIAPIIDRHFSRSMLGFRPSLGCFHALSRLKSRMRQGEYDFVVFLDVVRCFASIFVNRVMWLLRNIIGCKETLRWVQDDVRTRPPKRRIEKVRSELMLGGKALPADYSYLEALGSRERGIREGSALSPLLCNLYLSPLIERLEKSDPRIAVVNYADNIAIVCDARSLMKLSDTIEHLSHEFNLSLKYEQLISREDGATGSFLGYNVAWNSNEPNEPHFTPTAEYVQRTLVKINEVLNTSHSSTDDKHAALTAILSSCTYFRYGDLTPAYRAICATIGSPADVEFILKSLMRLHSRATYHTLMETEDQDTPYWDDEVSLHDRTMSRSSISGRAPLLVPLAALRPFVRDQAETRPDRAVKNTNETHPEEIGAGILPWDEPCVPELASA